eukprot:TRINITY_DN1531_c0_g1_i3.p1 TRINITY_DN1531_c0_g1~~TRINITY_DN1531_c0_g1_i3.p1  ORF type:complete len:653 (-),score=119.87 TRINITY_DN1531_c0_g1_i3:66-2024(-)
MFTHAYDSYMRYAFPSDELKPLSCTGGETLGGYMLTLVDTLDTLVVVGNYSEFEKQVTLLGQTLDFNKDVNVSVFETNIRIVGGLLSAHLLITESDLPEMESFKQRYNGSMLRLTLDVADRLLKAFDTATGLPFGTVNLMYGVPKNETPIVCTACAGTYALEFGILSRLTGDPKYETAARRAVRALWMRKSALNLVGNHINSADGTWTHRDSGIGGSIDSFFEYLLKAAILFDDDEYMDYFEVFYASAERHLRRDDWYMQADMITGQVTWALMSTLQAFWPGVQVLYGDYKPAARTMRAFQMIWRNVGFTPEGFGLVSARVEPGQARYPLRPEMAESLFYLAHASGDDTWWEYGVDIIHSIQNFTRTSCGYAVVEDVEKKTLGDQMESFFLAETLKYLYLLFDDDNFINTGQYVFNTEGHPIPIKYKFSYPNLNNEIYRREKEAQPVQIVPRETCAAQTYIQYLSTGSVPLWLLAQSARARDQLQQQQQQAANAQQQQPQQAVPQQQQEEPQMKQGIPISSKTDEQQQGADASFQKMLFDQIQQLLRSKDLDADEAEDDDLGYSDDMEYVDEDEIEDEDFEEDAAYDLYTPPISDDELEQDEPLQPMQPEPGPTNQASGASKDLTEAKDDEMSFDSDDVFVSDSQQQPKDEL